MAIRRAVLLIADIGGYTRYMNWNRAHLTHAQLTVAQLLESVIDAGKGIEAIGAPSLGLKERIKKDHSCGCASCSQLDALSLKFVAHEGEVAEQKVKRNVELAGIDVILVHRMLKNTVPVPEYVLMTDPVAHSLDEAMRLRSKPLMHDFEGIGETSTHYIDLAASDVTPVQVPERSSAGRLWLKVKLGSSSLPFRRRP